MFEDVEFMIILPIIMPKPIRLENRVISCLSNNHLSYVIVVLASFFWVSGFMFGNEHNFSFCQNQLSRYIMQCLICYTIAKIKGLRLQFRSSLEFSVLSIRSTIFTVHSFVLCWSQLYLPLYVVHTISAFGPIFVCLFAYLIYGKTINSKQMGGMAVALLGILLTVNGRAILAFLDPSFHFQSKFKNYKSDDPFVLAMVSLTLLGLVVAWGYGILITRKNQHHIVEVVYHQAVFGIIGSSVGYMFLEDRIQFPLFCRSLLWIGTVLGGGFTFFNCGIALSQSPGVTSMLTQTTVVYAYAWSVLRYGQEVNWVCLLGSGLLLFGVSMVIFLKTPPKPQPQMIQSSIAVHDVSKKSMIELKDVSVKVIDTSK